MCATRAYPCGPLRRLRVAPVLDSGGSPTGTGSRCRRPMRVAQLMDVKRMRSASVKPIASDAAFTESLISSAAIVGRRRCAGRTPASCPLTRRPERPWTPCPADRPRPHPANHRSAEALWLYVARIPRGEHSIRHRHTDPDCYDVAELRIVGRHDQSQAQISIRPAEIALPCTWAMVILRRSRQRQVFSKK